MLPVDTADGSSIPHPYVPPPPPPPTSPPPASPPGTSAVGPGTPAPAAPPTSDQLAALRAAYINELNNYNDDLDAINQVTQADDGVTLHHGESPTDVMNALGWSSSHQSSSKCLPGDGSKASNLLNCGARQLKNDWKTVQGTKAQLDEAQGVANSAKSYQSRSDSVTVSNPITQAVTPVLTRAQGAANTASSKVAADNAAIATTSGQIDDLCSHGPMTAGRKKQLEQLDERLNQEETQQQTDQGAVDSAQATVVAAKSVIYGQQADADQATWVSLFQTLHDQGVVDRHGNLIEGKTLTPEQQRTVNDYITAGRKVAADESISNQNAALLQQYATEDSQYATIALDAINNALAPLQMSWTWQSAGLDAAGAQSQVDLFTEAATEATDQWNEAVAFSAYAQQDQAVRDLQTKLAANPEDKKLQGDLTQAETDLHRLHGTYMQARSYAAEQRQQYLVKLDQQQLGPAQGSDALEVKQHLTQDQQQLGIAQAGMLTASAEVVAAPQLGAASEAQDELDALGQQLQQQDEHSTQCGPLSPTQINERRQAQAQLQEASDAPAVQVLGSFDVTANVLTTQSVQWDWSQIQAGVPGSSDTWGLVDAVSQSGNGSQSWEAAVSAAETPTSAAPEPLAASTLADAGTQLNLQVMLTQSAFYQSQFNQTAPENVQHPQNAADENARAQAWDIYERQHHVRVADEKVLAQFSGLKDGEKVDASTGMDEIKGLLDDQKKIDAARPWMERLYDGMSSSDPGAGTQSYLQGKLDELQTLIAQEDQLSAVQFNTRYATIMGGVAPQFDSLSQSEVNDTQNWQQLQAQVVGLVATTAAAVTGGFGGVVVYVALNQASDMMDNALTVKDGGSVEDDRGISLAAAFTNNFGTGGAGWQESKDALEGAGVQALEGRVIVKGVKFGAWLKTATGARWLPSALTRLGVDGLKTAPEGASLADMETTVAQNVGKSPLVSMGVRGANLTGFQVVSGGGQVLGSAANSFYEVTQHRETAQKAWGQIGQAAAPMLFDTLAAPLVGGLGGLTGNRVLQFASDAFTNTTLTAGYSWISGGQITLSDWISVALNTGLGELERSGAPRPPFSRRTQRLLTGELDRITAGDRPVDLSGFPRVRLPAAAAALPELGEAPGLTGDWQAANQRFERLKSQLDVRLEEPATGWAQLIETARLLDTARAADSELTVIESQLDEDAASSERADWSDRSRTERQESLRRAEQVVRANIKQLATIDGLPGIWKSPLSLIRELRAAQSNAEVQTRLVDQVYAELIRGPQASALESGFTPEEFRNSYVFLPRDIYDAVRDYLRAGASTDAFHLLFLRTIVAQDQLTDSVTAQSVLAHEADHLVVYHANPDFNWRARDVFKKTGFNLEEGSAALAGWRAFGIHRAAAARSSGLEFDTGHVPEVLATEFLQRLVGEDVFNRARYAADPQALDLVFQLAAGPVARFFNQVKGAIDRNANGASTQEMAAEGANSEGARTGGKRGIRRLFKFGAGGVALAVASPTLMRLGMHDPGHLRAMAAGGAPLLGTLWGKQREPTAKEPLGEVVTLTTVPVATGLDASGRPADPTSWGYPTWRGVAHNATAIALSTRGGGDPRTPSEQALSGHFAGARYYVVSEESPGNVFYGARGGAQGLELSTDNVFDDFTRARHAAARRPGKSIGAWIYVVDIEDAPSAPMHLPAEDIRGAMVVDKHGRPLPLEIPNVNAAYWSDGLSSPHAAFDGESWRKLSERLQGKVFPETEVYVYVVKGDRPLLEPGYSTRVDYSDLAGWGRVEGGRVRWYGRTVPGEGLTGRMPHHVDMVRMLGSDKVKRHRARVGRKQSSNITFIVSTTKPAELRDRGGLDKVAIGTDNVSLPISRTDGNPSWRSPTAQVASVLGAQLTARLFTAVPFLANDVVGGPYQTFLSQLRSWGTRLAYYRVTKSGLERALRRATRGDVEGAQKAIDHVIRYGPLYGLDKPKIEAEGPKLRKEVGEFATAVRKYDARLQDLMSKGGNQQMADYRIHLPSSVSLKAGNARGIPKLEPGRFIHLNLSGYDKEVLLGPELAAGPEAERIAALYQLVENYRTWRGYEEAGLQVGAGPEVVQAAHVVDDWAGGNNLLPQRLLVALEAEEAYAQVLEMIEKVDSWLDSAKVQEAMGSTMAIQTRWGSVFKKGALIFSFNSGVSASIDLVRAPVGSLTHFTNLVRLMSNTGEVIGNLPNAFVQWHYQRTLFERNLFGKGGEATDAQVEAYLRRRYDRMSRLYSQWSRVEKLLLPGVRYKATVARKLDERAEVRALQRGDALPEINITFSKYVIGRKVAAAERVAELKKALESRDPKVRRDAAAVESVLAAKSLNTAGDYMGVVSMYRYLAKGMGLLVLPDGNPVLAAMTLFHGLVSTPGWVMAQQGNTRIKIYGLRIAPTGIEQGNGYLGLKKLGRGYNHVVDASGQWLTEHVNRTVEAIPLLRHLPEMKNPAEVLRLEEGDTAAHNRRRALLLTTAIVVPIANLILPMIIHGNTASASNTGGGTGQTPTPASNPGSSGSAHAGGSPSGHNHQGGPPAGGGHSGTSPGGGQPPVSSSQFAVLPTDGLSVHASPSTHAQVVGDLREGTFVQSTGAQRADADGLEWIFVQGPGVSGWVEARYLEPHAEGAEAPAGGRVDPTLARQGFKAVEVFAGDTLTQIAQDSHVDLQSMLKLVERYILDPNEIFPGDVIYIPGTSSNTATHRPYQARMN